MGPANPTTKRSDWNFEANPAAATRESHGPKVCLPIVGVVVIVPSLGSQLLIARLLADCRRHGLLVHERVEQVLDGGGHEVLLFVVADPCGC